MNTYPFAVATIAYATREHTHKYAYLAAGLEVADDGETFITVWRYKTDGGAILFGNGYTDGSNYDARRRFSLGEFDPYHNELDDYYTHELIIALRDVYSHCIVTCELYRQHLQKIAGYADMEISTVTDGVQRLTRDW